MSAAVIAIYHLASMPRRTAGLIADAFTMAGLLTIVQTHL
jgi:hypothetical protein